MDGQCKWVDDPMEVGENVCRTNKKNGKTSDITWMKTNATQ